MPTTNPTEQEAIKAYAKEARKIAEPIMKTYGRICTAMEKQDFKDIQTNHELQTGATDGQIRTIAQAYRILGQGGMMEAEKRAAKKQARQDLLTCHPDRLGEKADAATRYIANITYTCINNAKETIDQGQNLSRNASGIAYTTDFEASARSIYKRAFTWTDTYTQTDETKLINIHIKA